MSKRTGTGDLSPLVLCGSASLPSLSSWHLTVAGQGNSLAEGFRPGFVVGPHHWAPWMSVSELTGHLQLAPLSLPPMQFVQFNFWRDHINCYLWAPPYVTSRPASPAQCSPQTQGRSAAHSAVNSACLGQGARPLRTAHPQATAHALLETEFLPTLSIQPILVVLQNQIPLQLMQGYPLKSERTDMWTNAHSKAKGGDVQKGSPGDPQCCPRPVPICSGLMSAGATWPGKAQGWCVLCVLIHSVSFSLPCAPRDSACLEMSIRATSSP